MIKLIASDLDGTLLCNGELGKRSVEVLRILNQKGIPFVVVTGRDLSGVQRFFQPYGIRYSAILGNGAQYYNEQGELLKSYYLALSLVKPICNLLDRYGVAYMIFCDDGFYCTDEPEVVKEAFIVRGMKQFHRDRTQQEKQVKEMPCSHLKKIEDIDQFILEKHKVIKFEAFGMDEERIEDIKEALHTIPGVSYLSSFRDNVEITDGHAQKGYILKEVLESYHIKEDEVAVFGDGMNDLSLFKEFRYSFAPENAEPTIKALAYEVIGAACEESVADKIESLISHS